MRVDENTRNKAFNFFAVISISAMLFTAFYMNQRRTVPERIESSCVSIHAGDSQGSGVIFSEEIDGKEEYFVLTAAHVVDVCRTPGIVGVGDSWSDVTIIREVRDSSGLHIGESSYKAKVMKYDDKADIAILYVGQIDGVTPASIDLSGNTFDVGTEVYHCGSAGGQGLGYNSVTQGIFSQVGKVFSVMFDLSSYFDQITCPALPGSSGGGVFLQSNGSYVGMLTMGVNGVDNFSYIIPSRLIVRWSKQNDMYWLFDGVNNVEDVAIDSNEFNPTESE